VAAIHVSYLIASYNDKIPVVAINTRAILKNLDHAHYILYYCTLLLMTKTILSLGLPHAIFIK